MKKPDREHKVSLMDVQEEEPFAPSQPILLSQKDVILKEAHEQNKIAK